MAAQSSVTLATRVYVPQGVPQGIATWLLRNDPDTGGRSLLTASVRGPSKDGIDRIVWKLRQERVQADDSACGCAGELIDFATLNVEAIVPDAWPDALRTELYNRLFSLASVGAFVDSVKTNTPVW